MRYDEIRKIEELSEYVSDKYDVKVPITNIEKLVERIGGNIVYENLKYDHNHIIKTGNESFIIKINNFYFPKDGKISDKVLKGIIANELGHLFLYVGYKVNDKLWKTMPIAENHVLDYNQNVDAQVFGNSLLMPRNEYEKVINKYAKNNVINTEIIADYFQVTLGNAIERGRTIGCF